MTQQQHGLHDFRTLFMSHPEPMWVYDEADLRIVEVNDAAIAAYGYTRDEFLRLTIRDLRTDNEQERLGRHISAGLAPLANSGVWRHRRRDGTLRWAEVRSHVTEFEGRVCRVAVATDVTDRLEAEAARERAAARTAALLRLASRLSGTVELSESLAAVAEETAGALRAGAVMVVLIDPETDLATVAAGFALPRTLADLPPLEGDRIRENFARFGRAHAFHDLADTPGFPERDRFLGLGIHSIAGVALMAGRVLVGTLSAMHVGPPRTFSPEELELLEGIAGLAGQALANAQVIRRQRDQEARLRESEARFRTIANAAPVMIWTSDETGACDFVNQTWLDFVGKPLESQLRYGWLSGIHPDERADRAASWNRTFARREAVDMEFRLLDARGEYRHLLNRAVPRLNGDGTFAGYAGLSIDITDRKLAEERMLQSQKLESLGVLAGGIAHDFNNLLVGILGNATLALDQAGANPELRESLEAIALAGRRAGDLARQMLAYSGRAQVVVEPLDLNALVCEMKRLITASLPRHIDLRLELCGEAPTINADATQLRQVLMNLALNAADAVGAGPGGITLRTSIIAADAGDLTGDAATQAPAPGPCALLEVQDSGCGMDADTMARIFDPFYTTKFTGRGLGLAAVLGIVRGHQGVIRVWSEPGKGSIFSILLPLAPGRTAYAETGSSAPTTWRGEGLVLVVDDEETVRLVTARALEYVGFEVVTAADGRQGVERFAEHQDRIRLVLLDMTMPQMSGDEAFDAIVAIQPAARVMLMSGYSEDETVDQFAGRPLAGFIQKPFDLPSLAQAVQRALGD